MRNMSDALASHTISSNRQGRIQLLLRSIPAALIWEMVCRGQLVFLLALFGPCFLPLVVIPILMVGGLTLDDPGMRLFAIRFMSFNALGCMASIIDFVSFSPRLYVLPITTRKLVASQMIPAMLIAGILYVLITSIENYLLLQNYPIRGPAFFVVAISGAACATNWYSRGSAWGLLAFITVVGLLAFWYLIRFSALFAVPAIPIADMTMLEYVGLTMAAIASVFATIEGVARDRCGKHSSKLEISQWDLRFLRTFQSTRFSTRLDAQACCEWRNKGLLMPVIMLWGAFLLLVAWIIGGCNPKQGVTGWIGGGIGFGFMFGAAGGLAIGAFGFRWDQSGEKTELDIGNFLASLPITNRELADVFLKLIGKSIFITSLTWGVIACLIFAKIAVSGENPLQDLAPASVFGWYLLASLIGVWTITSLSASITLTGARERLIQYFAVFIVLLVAYLFLSSMLLSADARITLHRACMTLVGIGFVGITIIAFVQAVRHRLISRLASIKCLLIWVGICGVIVFECFRNPMGTIAPHILAVGFAALAVLPFASAPLAIKCNRNR